MTDTPGRLLSSLSNVDGKPPKVGGCVSIFFHLFDWNRRISGKQLFSTKSLPAERPSSCTEKLPMAKLLLIADENRTAHSNSESQSEVGSERSSEYGSSKKPGVVARLMGLESFPEAEVQNKELFIRQQMEHKHRTLHGYQELQMLEDLLQRPPEGFRKLRKEIETSGANKVRGEEKMPKNARKDQDPMQKFAKLPLSPKKAAIPFASLLSPSKNSNKVAPPIKSQTTSRRTSLLMGAATRILEPGIQPSRSRPLLENAPAANENSTSAAKGGGSGFYSDLKRSLPKKQITSVEPEMKKSSGLVKGSASAQQGKAGSVSKTASNKDKAPDKNLPPKNPLSKQQKQHSRLEEVAMKSCGDQEELDDESLTDSQASSSKENRIAVGSGAKSQKVAGPPLRLSRSGSVKEEQPPTPPSRGSLFRSKSVREEAQSSPQPLQPASQQDSSSRCDKNTTCSTTTPTTSGGKEVRLKREKRQRSISLQEGTPEVTVQKARKPPLDQGRTVPSQRENLQAEQQEHQKQHQQKNKSTKQARNTQQENTSKSSSLLSYDRLFKTRKQPKSSGVKEDESKAGSRTMNSKDVSEEKVASTKPSSGKDEGIVNSQQAKSSDNSLMKSLLRRKPLSKAETVSSSKKKAVEKTKKQRDIRDQVQHAYERQTKSGGSSPARSLKEVSRRESVPTDVLKDRNQALEEPALDLSPEKVHAAEKVHFETDMVADKSLEEILKTLLSKSLGKASIGDSPLSGKKSLALERASDEAVYGADEDDSNVIDMELSPIEPQVTSRFEIDQSEDLPCKALQFEDDKQDITTPLALPLDSEVSKIVSVEVDGGQPSPVSVLDFSALQSPFPSEGTVSCEEIEDGNKCALDSDAESVFTGDVQQVRVSSSTCETSLDTTLESYPNFPEVGVEETASCEGQEIVFYVREVLLASGFITKDDDAAQTAAIPCTEEIFHRIESVRAAQQEEQQVEFVASCDAQLIKSLEAPGSCHKLMHDCIAEALDLVLDPLRDESLTNSIIAPSAAFLSGRPLGEDLVAEVSTFVLSWREMTLGMVDDLVEVDMGATSGKWKSFQEDSTEIGVDLERMIFRSTMEDLIADLIGSKLLGRNSRKGFGLSIPA